VLTKVDLGLFLASVGRLACFLLVAQENKTLRDLPGCFWRMLGLLDVSEVEKRSIFMSTTKAQHVAWQRYGVVQLGSPRGARRFPFVECSGDG